VLLGGQTSPCRQRLWLSVIALSFDQLVAWGVLYYAYNVLSEPIASDLHFSTQFIATAYSLALLLAGVLARPTGRVLDRGGPHGVMMAGALVGVIAFASLGMARGRISILIAFTMLGVAHALALYEPAFRAVIDWFETDRERSRALLVVTSIGGFASTVFLPATTFLVGRYGWRCTALILTLILGVVNLSVRPALPRHRPRPVGAHFGDKEAVATSMAVHLLAVGVALQSFATTGITVYLVWHLVERDVPLSKAATFAGLAGAAQVAGRLIFWPLQRLVRPDWRLPVLLALHACALIGIARGANATPLLWVALFGVTGGMMTLERAALTVEWFGRENFGTQSGQINSLALIARAASPLLIAWLHGTMSYGSAFSWLAVLMLLSLGATIAANHVRRNREQFPGQSRLVARK
jgi:MFS family permease